MLANTSVRIYNKPSTPTDQIGQGSSVTVSVDLGETEIPDGSIVLAFDNAQGAPWPIGVTSRPGKTTNGVASIIMVNAGATAATSNYGYGIVVIEARGAVTQLLAG